MVASGGRRMNTAIVMTTLNSTELEYKNQNSRFLYITVKQRYLWSSKMNGHGSRRSKDEYGYSGDGV